MTSPGDIVLVSCYELGHQPLAVASAAGFLARAGHASTCIDLSIRPLNDAALDACAKARLVAISVPMHTAVRLGAEVATRIRARGGKGHICFFGLYAPLNEAHLRAIGADSVLGGECEESLIALVENQPPERITMRRLHFAPPLRDGLPPIAAYAKLVIDGEERVAGHVEATRGCLHMCRHCPIPAVYDGRFFAVPVPTVIADALAQIAAGARHITFGDPDFLNSPKHGLAAARALHQAAPDVTFDFTAKVEHIVRNAALFPELARLGCIFVVSAFESVSDVVLGILAKGHNAAEMALALQIVRGAGISVRPTWLPFTPWTTLADYVALCRFIAEHALESEVDPVQLSLRLLLPPGSLLLDHPATAPHLSTLDPARFTYAWTHPDPRMDRLCDEVQELVERLTHEKTPNEAIFAAVYALAARAAGVEAFAPRASASKSPPHLSEPWFCCAEPTRGQLNKLSPT